MQIIARHHEAVTIESPIETTLVSPLQSSGEDEWTWPVGTVVFVEGADGVKLVTLVFRLPNGDFVGASPEMVADGPAIAQQILALHDGNATPQPAPVA